MQITRACRFSTKKTTRDLMDKSLNPKFHPQTNCQMQSKSVKHRFKPSRELMKTSNAGQIVLSRIPKHTFPSQICKTKFYPQLNS